MKYLAIIAAVVFMFNACKKPQEPEFIKVHNFKIDPSSSGSKYKLTADALFNNPNNVGITVTKTNLDVKVNRVDFGTIDQTNNVKVEKMANFTLPLLYEFDTKQLKMDNLGSMAEILLKKEVEVHLKGKVTVKVLGVGIGVPVDHKEKVPFKL